MDLNSLLGNSTDSTVSLFDPAKLIEPLMPFVIITTIISIVITVLYMISLIGRWRQGRAIIETRNILREMNERDKARSSSVATPINQLSAGTASNDSTADSTPTLTS